MAQDNIKNLYDALKGDYDLGSEQDFRNSLKEANNRRNLYKAISGSYDWVVSRISTAHLDMVNLKASKQQVRPRSRL